MNVKQQICAYVAVLAFAGMAFMFSAGFLGLFGGLLLFVPLFGVVAIVGVVGVWANGLPRRTGECDHAEAWDNAIK